MQSGKLTCKIESSGREKIFPRQDTLLDFAKSVLTHAGAERFHIYKGRWVLPGKQ